MSDPIQLGDVLAQVMLDLRSTPQHTPVLMIRVRKRRGTWHALCPGCGQQLRSQAAGSLFLMSGMARRHYALCPQLRELRDHAAKAVA